MTKNGNGHNGITPFRSRDLGVNLSDDWSRTFHVNKISVEARHIASWVLGAIRDRFMPAMITLIKSIVRSKVEYCYPLWKLEPCENDEYSETWEFPETVHPEYRGDVGLSKLNYWEKLKRLCLQSLQQKRERYTIIYAEKKLNGSVPNKWYDILLLV